MPAVVAVRPVLLSAPYADPSNEEVLRHLPTGHRTCGLVEITLADGTTGLGEGYLPVFAPHVFVALVELLRPALLGREALDRGGAVRALRRVTDYWSLQGAARHALSACEIALVDAGAKHLGVPAHALFGGRAVDAVELYGSGGASTSPAGMNAEIAPLKERGIRTFKIRARGHEVDKAVWALERAREAGIAVAIDMAQNLANPAQTAGDVLAFLRTVAARTDAPVAFVEEPLGPADLASYALLRGRVDAKIAGGEIVTTPDELCARIERGFYDIVQPDATVIGGIGAVLEVFAAARRAGCRAVVHAWCGGVGLMANYHAAFAGGGALAEWPMPAFPLRDELTIEPLRIAGGRLTLGDAPGLGVRLTPDIEARFPFREDAAYRCDPLPVEADPSIWRKELRS